MLQAQVGFDACKIYPPASQYQAIINAAFNNRMMPTVTWCYWAQISPVCVISIPSKIIWVRYVVHIGMIHLIFDSELWCLGTVFKRIFQQRLNEYLSEKNSDAGFCCHQPATPFLIPQHQFSWSLSILQRNINIGIVIVVVFCYGNLLENMFDWNLLCALTDRSRICKVELFHAFLKVVASIPLKNLPETLT